MRTERLDMPAKVGSWIQLVGHWQAVLPSARVPTLMKLLQTHSPAQVYTARCLSQSPQYVPCSSFLLSFLNVFVEDLPFKASLSTPEDFQARSSIGLRPRSDQTGLKSLKKLKTKNNQKIINSRTQIQNRLNNKTQNTLKNNSKTNSKKN